MQPLHMPLFPYTTLFRSPRSATGVTSNRHRGLDRRMRIVPFDREIFVFEREEIVDRRVELHRRQSKSEEHTSELQSPGNIVCGLQLEKKHGTTLTSLEGA